MRLFWRSSPGAHPTQSREVREVREVVAPKRETKVGFPCVVGGANLTNLTRGHLEAFYSTSS